MAGRPNNLLQTNELQLLALAVYNHLLLLSNVSCIIGAGHLYHDIGRNVEVCKTILGTRILSAMERGGDERRNLQQRVKEFRDLMLENEEYKN